MNYTQRTLDYLRDEWSPKRIAVVERWIMGANVRRDLFEIVDIVAIVHDKLWGVQSTSYGARAEHIEKLLVEKVQNVTDWLATGMPLVMVSWKKVKRTRGGKAFRYVPVVDHFTLAESGAVQLVELGEQVWIRRKS